MKIYVAHATQSHFREELYKPLRESSLNTDQEIYLPQEYGRETITKEFIKSCNLIIAECSFPSTGEGIELGWADIYNVPILCIYKKGIEPSKALYYVSDNLVAYENKEDMITKITAFISRI